MHLYDKRVYQALRVVRQLDRSAGLLLPSLNVHANHDEPHCDSGRSHAYFCGGEEEQRQADDDEHERAEQQVCAFGYIAH